jgi:putative acetyltransferase
MNHTARGTDVMYPDSGRDDVLIRPEIPDDHAAVHALNASAFESPAEAALVDRLRCEADPIVSVVAEVGAKVVGHIMFTPVALSADPHLRVMGLAPMAVASAYRRQGIGAALVRRGFEGCARLGCGAVVVLGHPGYYPRFGFRSGASFGLSCEYDVPLEAFMAVELQPGYLAGSSGTVSYHVAFADL